jgi:hypothetical protein
MPEAMTYDSLVEDIKLYAERSDDPFITQIPRFIMLAENRLATEVKGLGFMKVVNFTLNGPTMDKPIRWRETKAIALIDAGDMFALFPRSYEYCRSYWPNLSDVAVPEFYADYDYEHFLVVPSPNKVYSGELRYYERPEPLSESNQTNWITQYAPQLLLYASLLEAQPFLKLSDRIAEFQGLYERALKVLKVEDAQRVSDLSANRSGA